ncbi:MAG: methylated-DNA--[protein]-cysteine S-methyltransferase [Magnetovibrio sp.]|nr:methylated-DNA--[protein]-cysteine S-methyltransferase [Magnetovibrio sp.]
MNNDNSKDYERIEKAIGYIVDNRLEQPDLDQVAAEVGLSPFHFQRLFSRWAGVSPKKFLGSLTLAHARELLDAGESVLGASLDVGLSSPSRLHDLFVSFEAMTPGDYKNGGANLNIDYSTVDTPFGPAVLMRTPLGICGFEFLENNEHAQDVVRARWPQATLSPGTNEQTLADQIFQGIPGEPIRLHVKGTNFQTRVWQALLSIPPHHATTYKRLAAHIDSPKAARAVGAAVGANPVAVLIPCHRVIRETGVVDGYRWGSHRKRALLGWESVA